MALNNPPVFDIFDKFREFIPWVSLEGFTAGGDATYVVSVDATRLHVCTSSTIDDDAYLYTNGLWTALLDTGKLTTFEFPLVYLDSVADVNVWARFALVITDPPSETVQHFGWKIIDADLYASNADGTTQKITDTAVNLAAVGQRTRLKIIFNPGTDCKYYVNDVLKVTHTENLPTLTACSFHIHIRTKAAIGKTIQIGRLLIEKEHA